MTSSLAFSPAHAQAAVPRLRYLAGVDGGGSGTRARLQDLQGLTLGEGSAGPSGLGQGVAQAWRHIEQALAQAFADAGLPAATPGVVALGLGLAGASVADQRTAFLAADPGYALCVLDTDAVTQLMGAHGGRPGLVVAAGTGSVAAARYADGRVRLAGGWGFPVGDEGSGAWLGLRAMQHAQAVLDGRALAGPLSAAVLALAGPDAQAVQAWCARAGQHAYAQLAPQVFAAAERGDVQAQGLLQTAADELARLVPALQAGAAEPLPVVMRGSVGEALASRWPEALRARLVHPLGDSASGALTCCAPRSSAVWRQPVAPHGDLAIDPAMKPLPFSFKPDLRSTTPLYVQLSHRLAQHIRDGSFLTHEALPSERVLSDGLNLSRVTARKAIDRLVDQGLIVRKRGSGNYIAPQLEQPLSRLTSFSEELRQRGFEPSSRWLTRACTAATPDEQLSLGLSPGARVARLERLRLADGTVMAYEISVLPEPVLPDPQLVQSSLYEHLGTLGKAPARALQHIRAMNADPRRAELLGVPTGHALLFITRVGYLDTGAPVELTLSYCRSDYYGFVSEMRREA